MPEINLMHRYPRTQRALDPSIKVTQEQMRIARQFGKDFFDGDRMYGYGGYSYHPRFWKDVVQDFIAHYKLTPASAILDIGCGKGFMLYDFVQALPGVRVRGIDISQYAIENAKPEVKPFLSVGNAKDLSAFADKEFDLVASITTVHNLPSKECKQALREIERVGKKAFITVDAWSTEEERVRMHAWNKTALTYMHVSEWQKLFDEAGYKGDYYWFIP